MFPKEAESGETLTLTHTWENLGWGYCPNNIRQWNFRYKPSFALIDGNGKVVKTFVDSKAEPSDWRQSKPVSYTMKVALDDVPSGTYTWAVSIADTRKNDVPGLNMAVDAASLTADGWLKVGKITVE